MSKDALTNNAALIWSVAEIIRGDFKQSEYQKVVLPFAVLRRLDAVLADGKAEFLAKAKAVEGMDWSEVALQAFAKGIYLMALPCQQLHPSRLTEQVFGLS